MRSSSVRSNNQQSPRGVSTATGHSTALAIVPAPTGGYPRAQSLAGDFNAGQNKNFASTIDSNNNNNKLHHLLRFINHKQDEGKYASANNFASDNFFTGSRLVRELTGLSAKCMACVGDTVWIGEKGGALSVWDLQTGDLIKRKEAQRNRTFVTAVAGVGIYVWVGYSDGLVRIFDPDTLQLLKEVKEHSGAINQLMLSYNGLSVYSASADFSIVQWDANSVERVAVLNGHKGAVRCMTTAVGLRLFSGSDDGSIIEWDVVRAKPRHVLANSHRGSVRALAATAGHLWSGGEDGTVRLWSLTNETNTAAQQFSNGSGSTYGGPSPVSQYGSPADATTNGKAITANNKTIKIPTASSPPPSANRNADNAAVPLGRHNTATPSDPVFAKTATSHSMIESPGDTEAAGAEDGANEGEVCSSHEFNTVDDGMNDDTTATNNGEEETGNNSNNLPHNFLADLPSTNDQLLATSPVCVHIITNPHTSAVTALVIVGSYVWSSSASKFYMWNAETFELEGEFNQKDGTGGDNAGSGSPASPSSAGFITCVSAVHQSVVARLWTCGSEGTVKMWNAESKWSSAFKAAQDEHVQRMELLLNANADREQQLEAGFEKMREATLILQQNHDDLAKKLKQVEAENANLRADLEESQSLAADQAEDIAALNKLVKKLKSRLPQNKFERNLRSLLRGVCQSHQDVYGAEEDDNPNNLRFGGDLATDSEYDSDNDEQTSRRRRSQQQEEDNSDDDLDSVINYGKYFATNKKDCDEEQDDEDEVSSTDEGEGGDNNANAGYSKLIKPYFESFDLLACAKLQAQLEELRQLHTDPFKGEDEIMYRWRHGDYRFGDPKVLATADDVNADDNDHKAALGDADMVAVESARTPSVSISVEATKKSAPVPLTAAHINEAQQNIVRLEMLALRVQVAQLATQTSKAAAELKDLINGDAPAFTANTTSAQQQQPNQSRRQSQTALEGNNSSANNTPRGASDGSPVLTPRRRAAAAVLAQITGDVDHNEQHGEEGEDNMHHDSATDDSPLRNSPGGGAAPAHVSSPATPPAGVALIDIDDIEEDDLRILMNIKKRALLASAEEAKAEKKRRLAKRKEAQKQKKKAKAAKKRAAQLRRRGIVVDEDDEENLDYNSGSGSESSSDDSALSDVDIIGSDSDNESDDGLMGATTTLQLVMKKYINTNAANGKQQQQYRSEKQQALQALLNLSDEDMAALYMGPIPCPKSLNDDDKAMLALIRLKYEPVTTWGADGASTTPGGLTKKKSKGTLSSSSASNGGSVAPQLIAVRTADGSLSTAVLGYLTTSELKHEEVEALKKIAKKYPQRSSSAAVSQTSTSSPQHTPRAGASPSVAAAAADPDCGGSAYFNRRINMMEAVVSRHCPIAIVLPPFGNLPRRELAHIYAIYKKYRKSIVDLKPEDEVLAKEQLEKEMGSSFSGNNKNKNGGGLTMSALSQKNAHDRDAASDHHGPTYLRKSKSFVEYYKNDGTAAEDDFDAKSTGSRRSSGTRYGSSKSLRLYSASKDFPSLTTGVPATLLRLRADVETSLASVLQAQARTRNEITAITLELAEAKQLLDENEELHQLLQEGEDKEMIRRERKAQRRAEKAQRKAAKLAKKNAKKVIATDFNAGQDEQEEEDHYYEEGNAAPVYGNDEMEQQQQYADDEEQQQQPQYDNEGAEDGDYEENHDEGNEDEEAQQRHAVVSPPTNPPTPRDNKRVAAARGVHSGNAQHQHHNLSPSSSVDGEDEHTSKKEKKAAVSSKHKKSAAASGSVAAAVAAAIQERVRSQSKSKRAASPVTTTTTQNGSSNNNTRASLSSSQAPSPSRRAPTPTKSTGATPRGGGSNGRSTTPIAPPSRVSDVRK